MNRAHLYGDTAYNDPIANPGFILPPTNEAQIKLYLRGRWYDGHNYDWSYDIQQDLNAIWPMNEDLSYTNATLMTAGMGGFPLGDLYRWWPAQYTAWKAQEAVENDTINRWLTYGFGPSVGVTKQLGSNIPSEYALDQNYPNPFNPTTQINYSVPGKGFVSLKVYNLLGQEVATLFNGVQNAGNYVATFDGAEFASGVYLYRLQSGSVSLTKKFVLMK
jgi:hypothetical protein